VWLLRHLLVKHWLLGRRDLLVSLYLQKRMNFWNIMFQFLCIITSEASRVFFFSVFIIHFFYLVMTATPCWFHLLWVFGVLYIQFELWSWFFFFLVRICLFCKFLFGMLSVLVSYRVITQWQFFKAFIFKHRLYLNTSVCGCVRQSRRWPILFYDHFFVEWRKLQPVYGWPLFFLLLVCIHIIILLL